MSTYHTIKHLLLGLVGMLVALYVFVMLMSGRPIANWVIGYACLCALFHEVDYHMDELSNDR